MNLRTLLFSALALFPLSASALDWHAGIGVGSELDGRIASAGDGSIDARSTVAFVVGTSLANRFGVEASYADLGRIRQTGVADGGFDLDGELWTVGATYAAGSGALRPYAKLGWFSREDSGIANTIAGPRRFKLDDDGLHAEVGARWHLTERLALRAGYAWYDFDGGSDGNVQVLAEMHF